MPQHLSLFVEIRNGKPVREPVHVSDLGGGRFRLLYSPGFLQGIAAGDEFRVLDDDGRFEVLSRSGNLAVQVFSSTPVRGTAASLVEEVSRLGGTLDGAVDQGLVFTVPLGAGFAAVEELFNRWIAEHPGWEWYFGNVYDPSDGVTPLNWWRAG